MGLFPFQVPTSVIVRGTIQRASIVPNARRSFIMGRDAVLLVQTQGRIPPYAFDYMVYSTHASSAYAAGSSLILRQSAATVTTIVDTIGPELLAALATGARFPVPAMVDAWEFNNAAPANQVVILDFGVGF
jgi:hypothetical protein